MPRKELKRTPNVLDKIAQEKFQGRLTCLMRKAHEIGDKCESKVYVVLRRQGRYYTYKSETSEDWPPPEQEVESSIGGDHQTPKDYADPAAKPRRGHLRESSWKNDVMRSDFVPPIEERSEGHIGIPHPQHQEPKLDNVMPLYKPARPTHMLYTSTAPQLLGDILSLHEPTRMQYFDQNTWRHRESSLAAGEHKGEMDSTPLEAQFRVRTMEGARKSLAEETASRDQEHFEEAGVVYTQSHKRKLQTPEESDEDGGLNKQKKLSHQSVYQDSKSCVDSASLSPRALGLSVLQTESPDLADDQLWLTGEECRYH